MSEDVRDTEKFFHERGFGQEIGFGQRPAIVVVDLIYAFTNPNAPLGSDLDAVMAATIEVLTAARQAGVPIFHTTVRYDDDLHDAGIWYRKQSGITTLRAGTRGVELDERLDRRPGEPLIAKKYASAFFGTDFSSRLTSSGIDTLVITGCTTSGCVRATAVDAVQLGFRPMVVREAVGDRSPRAHEQSLFDLHQKYADVVSLTQTTSYLSAIATSAE